MMQLIVLFTLLLGLSSTFAQNAQVELEFNEGASTYLLRVDAKHLGLRFDDELDEAEIRSIINSLPHLAPRQSEKATVLLGKTIILETSEGFSAEEAISFCAELRHSPEIISASPRLWLWEDPRFLTESILVRWKESAPIHAIGMETKNLVLIDELNYSTNKGQVFRVPSGADPLAVSNKLANSGLVEFASPNFQLLRVPMGGTNDPIYPDQWHLESIGQNGAKIDADIDVEEAWDITRGDANITVAVIDTGVELNHPDLRDHLLQGIDVLDNDNNPKAEDYLFGLITENHSTSVCGVAAGHGNNGIGISGVSQESGIIPIRFLSEWIFNQPTLQDEVDAFNFAHAAGAAVVNNSWGPTGAVPLPAATKAAIDDISENGRGGLGSVVVFAAGNSGADMSRNGYASYPLVVAVSACTDQELLTSYSSFGKPVDVCAPSNGGVNGITTTDRLGGKGYSNGDYTDEFGGTSSASPCTAGVLLLMLSANPNMSRHEAMGVLLGNTDLIDAASGSYNNMGHSNFYGYGRVNAALATAASQRVDSVVFNGPGTASVGQSASFTIGNAPANGNFSIYYSMELGNGIIQGLHPCDLGGKPKVAGTGNLDASGQASWNSPIIPNSMQGKDIYLEVYASDSSGLAYDSEAIKLTVL